MKAKKPLTSKTTLKTKKPLQAKKPTKKQEQAEITKLKKKADELFGHYVRLRDAELVGNIEWHSECISCGRVNIVRWFDEDKQKWRWGRKENIGHYVSRRYWFLRFNDINCNGQCVYCNQHLSGNNAAYHKALDYKYGDGTANELIDLAEEHKDYAITKTDLEQAIAASNDYLEWVYKMEKELLHGESAGTDNKQTERQG